MVQPAPTGIVIEPDNPQRMPRKAMRVTSARIPPIPRVSVALTKSRRSSAMRWSGLSVSEEVSCMR